MSQASKKKSGFPKVNGHTGTGHVTIIRVSFQGRYLSQCGIFNRIQYILHTKYITFLHIPNEKNPEYMPYSI